MAEAFPNRLAILKAQEEKLRALLEKILPANKFYAAKLKKSGRSEAFSNLELFCRSAPFTFKSELEEDQRLHQPYGSNLTFPLDQYTRCHQTTGTSGRAPLRWLDTPESWNWMVDSWAQVHRVAGVRRGDRVFFAFSFGPFIGFWLAFEAAERLGCLCFSGGGLSTVARLHSIFENEATVLCCTPSYAIRMGEVAETGKMEAARRSKVRLILVAGEPGGSIPATRQRIGQLWPGARVFDHHGMTEIGPVTFECPARPSVLHVLEDAFIAEIIDSAGKPVERGQAGELVLTTLGRVGSPLLRYRTGDIVRAATNTVCDCGRSDLALEGGILGRADDMVVIRGVNVYPSAVEEIVRGCGEVAEYQVRVSRSGALAEIRIEVEPVPNCRDIPRLLANLENKFETTMALRVPIQAVTTGALPRFEMKAKRWLAE